MKAAFKTLLGLAIVAAVVLTVRAEDAKDEKVQEFKGTLGCAKCVFKLSKDVHGGKCMNAIKVKEGDKDVVYFFDDKGAKEEYHEEVCGGAEKEGTVIGAVTKKDGKLYIKPSKVEYTKK